MPTNNGLYYYRYYFDGLPCELIAGNAYLQGSLATENQANARSHFMIRQEYKASGSLLPLHREAQPFFLKTAYPGLLCGVGYPHGVGQESGDDNRGIPGALELGFYFDHTTGLPVIPGSSVKGVLRSHFIDRTEYVATVLTEDAGVADPLDIDLLAKAIFGSPAKCPGTCVFLDAYPVKPSSENRLLGLDYITPHPAPEGYEGLKEPKVHAILKVIPDVTYAFRFLIPETVCGLKRDQVLKVFKQLILDMGVGAKTNVSFGVFNEATSPLGDPKILQPV